MGSRHTRTILTLHDASLRAKRLAKNVPEMYAVVEAVGHAAIVLNIVMGPSGAHDELRWRPRPRLGRRTRELIASKLVRVRPCFSPKRFRPRCVPAAAVSSHPQQILSTSPTWTSTSAITPRSLPLPVPRGLGGHPHASEGVLTKELFGDGLVFPGLVLCRSTTSPGPPGRVATHTPKIFF